MKLFPKFNYSLTLGNGITSIIYKNMTEIVIVGMVK